jgi:cysteinyl-tRNA synthetase
LRNFFRERGGGGPGGPPPGTRVESPGAGSDLAGSQVPVGGPPGSRIEAFREALADDFNTPRAMAEVFELVAEANRGEVPGASEALLEMLELVGLESLAEAERGGDAEADALLAEREEARAAKDFARADEIRDQLAAMGWEVRDSSEGAKLVPKA